MTDTPIGDLAHEATGITPKTGEVMAMDYLLRQAIEDAREGGKEDLADLGEDFLRHFEDVEVTLHQAAYFKREYVEYEG